MRLRLNEVRLEGLCLAALGLETKNTIRKRNATLIKCTLREMLGEASRYLFLYSNAMRIVRTGERLSDKIEHLNVSKIRWVPLD